MKLDKELNITGYARNQARSSSNNIADLLSKIDLSSGMVRDGLLDDQLYMDFVMRAKKEIKDSVSMIYSYLHLQDVEGHYDQVFTQPKSKGD
ncbi:hypothetical protein [Paenibacillus sp. FSL H8-0168]|uniref:hypothetical protein n=1 Tax=Paenibacillus sp. FSL H8-0168 TaxID=2921378 RepID=UPI0031597414